MNDFISKLPSMLAPGLSLISMVLVWVAAICWPNAKSLAMIASFTLGMAAGSYLIMFISWMLTRK